MKERNKGGRPSLTENERRDKVVPVRFSAAEYQTLKEHFKKSGYRSFGSFIYAKVLQHKINVMERRWMPEELRPLFRASSNNINQIAHELNLKRYDPLVKEMSQQLEIVARSYEELIAEMKRTRPVGY